MKRIRWSRGLSLALALALLLGAAAVFLGAERQTPGNPLPTDAERLQVQRPQGGDSQADGESESPEESGQTEESEEEASEPTERPPEVTEASTRTSAGPEPTESSHSTDGTEPSGETDPSRGEEPTEDTGSGPEPTSNGNNGEEPTEDTGGETPGEYGLVTDLYSHVLTADELTNGALRFYAYYSDPDTDARIRVNFRHESETGSGVWLTGQDTYYSAQLRLGVNYILISYTDWEGQRQYSRFVLTYEADKANETRPTVGEHPPTISTNLDGWEGYIKTQNFTLHVRARSWKNQVIYANQIEVCMDGRPVTNPTGSGDYEYALYFERPNYGDVGRHEITVFASDGEGNSRFVVYQVEYFAQDEGAVIGKVHMVIDATTVGLGVLDADQFEIVQGQPAAATVLAMLAYYDYTPVYDGSVQVGFYLRSISRPGTFAGAAVPERLAALLERDGIRSTGPCSMDSLGEYDFTTGSGWMYSLNGALYPGKGLSEYYLNDGDTLYLRFTLAYGKDIGGYVATGGGYGSLSSYCGMWIDGGYVPLEHDWQESGRLEPAVGQEGYVDYVCSRCAETKRETLPALTEPAPEPTDPPDPVPEPSGTAGCSKGGNSD